jgi:hypothetical protein
MNCWPALATVYWLPFARDSSVAGTISGTTAWDALANTTSHTPSPKPTTARTGTLAFPTARRTVTAVMMTAWSACDCHIRLIRSRRSTIAPAGSDSSSHGR